MVTHAEVILPRVSLLLENSTNDYFLNFFMFWNLNTTIVRFCMRVPRMHNRWMIIGKCFVGSVSVLTLLFLHKFPKNVWSRWDKMNTLILVYVTEFRSKYLLFITVIIKSCLSKEPQLFLVMNANSDEYFISSYGGFYFNCDYL